MRFNWIQRSRVACGRPAFRALIQSGAIRRHLLKAYADDIARGLDPDLTATLAIDSYTHDSDVTRRTPEKARAAIAESCAIVDAEFQADVNVRAWQFQGAASMLGARVYQPESLARPSPGLLYVHGGGWVTCDLDTHDSLCRRVAHIAKIRVVSIEYRLAPEHRFPAAADDALAAFRQVVVHADELGLDPNRIGIGGDSAGGNLSAVVSLDTRGDRIRPALQWLLYPALDAACEGPSFDANGAHYFLTREAVAWYYAHYLGEDRAQLSNPRLSPMAADDLRDAPPAYVVVAGFDPLYDEGVAYARRLQEAGVTSELVRYPSLVHGFALMTGASAAALAATDEMAVTLGRLLRSLRDG